MRTLPLLLLLAGCAGVQSAGGEGTSPVETVETHELTQGEAFDRLSTWVAESYRSARHVVQHSDRETGTLVIRGAQPLGFPSEPLDYVMTVDVRDGRVRFRQSLAPAPFISASNVAAARSFFAGLRVSAMEAIAAPTDNF